MLSKKIQKVTVDAIVSECWLDLLMNGAVPVLMSTSAEQSFPPSYDWKNIPQKPIKDRLKQMSNVLSLGMNHCWTI